MKKPQRKALLIRFSSIGDVVQSLSAATRLKEYDCEVHWVIRKDLKEIAESHSLVKKVWALDRNSGVLGLLKLIFQLRQENFTHIYDAHNSLRSLAITLFLTWPFLPFAWKNEILVVRKPKYRWKRFLLFYLRKNTFQMPFSGQRDLLQPLKSWGLTEELPPSPQILVKDEALAKVHHWLKKNLFPHNYVVLCPSASYELKRWPLGYWQKLINANPEQNFLVLGGKTDSFLEELIEAKRGQILKSIGELSLAESVAAISMARAVVSNDTGLLHMAEQLGKKAIALMGPAPFGFPSRSTTLILEKDLSCRPCSKHGQGPCINAEHQKCLKDISPEFVSQKLNLLLSL